MDEVIEEVNPFHVKQNPLKGKRKEALKNTPSSELNLKKKKGKISAPRVVEGELSFVTLDEIGQQYQHIKSIFRKMEDTFTDEQKQLVHELIVESEVYQAVRKHFNEQIEFDGDFIV